MRTDSQYEYCQSLPLEWLKAPQERDRASLLEFVRGSIFGLSARENTRFDPVHVSRLQNSFKRLGAPGLYKGGLRLLELLREAEPLFGGYWLPTPFRVVEIEKELVFVGAVPNAFGLLGDVQKEGLSRLLTREVGDRFPRQSLEGWMGVAPLNPADLVTAFTEKHARTAANTSNLTEVECLSMVPNRATRQHKFRWSEKVIATLPDEQIAICRQSRRGRMRYFSASLKMGRIVAEAPIDLAIFRLLFAIARHTGAPIKAVIRPGPYSTEVTVEERLPIEEFRLSLLLSREVIRMGRSTRLVLSPKLAPAFSARLAVLGCALETLQ